MLIKIYHYVNNMSIKFDICNKKCNHIGKEERNSVMSAKYLEIQQDIMNKIETKTYAVGAIIPSETQLAKQYQVSRPTVRQAISQLVEQGILERKRKRGTLVCPPKIDQNFAQKIDRFDADIKRQGHISETKVLFFKKEIASEEIQKVLHTDEVYKLVRLRYVDHEPNVFVTTYAPCHLFPMFEHCDFSKHSFYDMCEQAGHGIASITRKLEVVCADETLADLLQIHVQDPLFYFHSYGYDANGVPIEYSIAKYRGDTNSFTFTLQKTL